MDYSGFHGAQQKFHQFATMGGYDPSQTQQALHDSAQYAFNQQFYPYDYQPSAYHHSYQPPPPPLPPGTDHSACPTPFQIHPSEVLQGDHHPAALQPPPPLPPGTDNSACPTPFQIHPSEVLQGDRHPAALQQQAARASEPSFSGHSVALGTTSRATSVWTVDAVAVAPNQHPLIGGVIAREGGSRRGSGTFRGGRGQRRKVTNGSRQDRPSVVVEVPVTATTAVAGSLPVVMEPNQEALPTPAPAVDQQSMIPRLPIFPLAWCDICRVDCNSLQVLEQHKNGKRHKKTLQRMQQIQAQQKLMADLHAKCVGKSELVFQSPEQKVSVLGEINILSSQMSGEQLVTAGETSAPAFLSGQFPQADKAVAFSGNMASAPVAPQAGEANRGFTSPVSVIFTEVNETNIISAASENMPAATSETDHNIRSEESIQTIATQSECTDEVKAGNEAPTSAMPDYIEIPTENMKVLVKRRGAKRKMRYWQDGKRLKKPKDSGIRTRERPDGRARVCTLCNITCDTQAVFECHLSGRKHLSRVKRFQGQNTVFGPISVYIPPNQPTSRPQDPEPLFYGLKTKEMFLQAPFRPEAAALGTQSQLGRGQDEDSIPYV